MLLRMRAWDIMREEFAVARPDQSLGELIRILAAVQERQPDAQAVAVIGEDGSLKGVVSIWTILEGLEGCLDQEGKTKGEWDWDRALKSVGLSCAQTSVERIMLKEIPLVRPSDSLIAVLETFLRYRRGYCLVEEGGRVIGMIHAMDLYREIGRSITPAI